MYKHFDTRKRLIRRIIAYVFMLLAIIVGVAAATIWIMGYRFDMEQRTIDRISLVQFQTVPAGAQIYVNDNRLGFLTPGRDDGVRPGANTIRFSLDGYRNWQKTVNLKPAEVRWLTYARLVPDEITTDVVADFTGFHQATSSPNGNWILLHQSPEVNSFKLIDISDPRNVRIGDLVIPDSATPGIEIGTFSVIEWDSSSNYILVQRTIGDVSEVIYLDRRDATNSLNLTRLFNTTIRSARFSTVNNRVVFGLTGDGDLRRFEINSKTMSAPLLSGVSTFDIYGDGKLSYVSVTDSKQTAGIHHRDQTYQLMEYTDTKPTLVAFVHYYRTDYFVVARGTNLTIIAEPLGRDPSEKISVEVPNGMAWLSYNNSGRFVMVGQGENVVSYDLETNESFAFDIPGLTSRPKWIDDYHVYCVHENNLVMMEFDGANREVLVPATNFGVFSANNRFLLSFLLGETGVSFQRSSMIIE